MPGAIYTCAHAVWKTRRPGRRVAQAGAGRRQEGREHKRQAKGGEARSWHGEVRGQRQRTRKQRVREGRKAGGKTEAGGHEEGNAIESLSTNESE